VQRAGGKSDWVAGAEASQQVRGSAGIRVLKRRSQCLLVEAGSARERTWLFDPSGEVELLVELLASRGTREHAVRDFVAHRDGATHEAVWSALRKLDELGLMLPAPEPGEVNRERELIGAFG
jgi:hypothetical protein